MEKEPVIGKKNENKRLVLRRAETYGPQSVKNDVAKGRHGDIEGTKQGVNRSKQEHRHCARNQKK